MTGLLDKRWVIPLLAFLAAVPLLWPQIPPLIDLPGHMGRYRIQTGIRDSPALAAVYSFQWRLLGNLGVDLLIEPMSRLFGVEFGTKLIILAIPPLTVTGMLLVAREVHGRVPPTALFALPLAYHFPFQFGFVNFSLGIALALCALALWIRMGRSGKIGMRAAVFVPLSCLLWLTHMVGWGLFGIAAFGTEWVRRARAGESVVRAALFAGLTCMTLALPLLPMALLRETAVDAGTHNWFVWGTKIKWVSSMLRDRWQFFDVFSAWTLVVIAGIAVIKREIDLMLAVPAGLCVIAFAVMPFLAMGSAYADMRLVPFTAMLGLLSIRAPEARWAKWVAAAALLFLTVRLAATTVSFVLYDRLYRSELVAIERLPHGAQVLSLVLRPCPNAWTTDRLDHLPAIAIVRRDAFSNDQWTIDSAQALEIIKPGVGKYGNDPSQLVYPKICGGGEGSDLQGAVDAFNPAVFDYVWTIAAAPRAVRSPLLTPIWSNGRSTLYRVAQRTSG